METLQKQFPLRELADALEVSPSGYHAHTHKSQGLRRQQDQELSVRIARSFLGSRQTYGCRRLRRDLQEQGQGCGVNRISRLMRAHGWRARQKRRFRPRTTDARHRHPIAPNWLATVPSPDRPGQIWQSDLTYLPTQEGWLYLAFTLDGCSRRCVAHHAQEDLGASLTKTTLAGALQRCPPPPGLIHHSDRGVQYAATAFQEILRLHHLTPSMSRSGNPYDNALAESFVATLKTECFAGTIPATRQEARRQVFDYIETFYNPHRRHSALNYCSPLEFEAQFDRLPKQTLNRVPKT